MSENDTTPATETTPVQPKSKPAKKSKKPAAKKPSKAKTVKSNAGIYTAFRCPDDILQLAKAKATKENRSLSNFIITLLHKDLD